MDSNAQSQPAAGGSGQGQSTVQPQSQSSPQSSQPAQPQTKGDDQTSGSSEALEAARRAVEEAHNNADKPNPDNSGNQPGNTSGS